MRFLRYATALYATGLVLHTGDHLRRGIDVVTPQVLWLGNLSTAAGLAVIALVVLGHRWAPAAAAIFGPLAALGVAVVHFLPTWSSLSDAFPGAHGTGVTSFSWFVVSVEIVGAVLMGLAGMAIVRRERAWNTPAPVPSLAGRFSRPRARAR